MSGMKPYVYALPMIFSLLGAFLTLVKRLYFEEAVSIAASLASVFSSLWIISLPLYSGHYFYIDGLSKIMLLVISVVYATAVLFSTTYMKYVENPSFERHFYYFLMNIFAFSMLFTVSVSDLGLMWIGVEATTVTSALLVATENTESTVEATWRYIIVVSVGLIISLLSNVFIYSVTNTLKIVALTGVHHTFSSILAMGGMMAVIGYGTKAGVFPMHSWLPDVHGKAPAPVSAVFSGILLSVALFAIERVLQAVNLPIVREFAFWLGILTVATAALLMVVQRHYKRLFAYSTMENMGMILVGFSMGHLAFVGAVVLMISHAFAKSAVFYLSGNILARYKSKLIRDVNGVAKLMPFTGYTLVFSALGVTGTPPFATFFGEMMILYVVMKDFGLPYALLIALFLFIAFIAMNYKVASMVFSEPTEEDVTERKHVGRLVPIFSVAFSLLTFVFIPQIQQLLSKGMIR